MAGAGVGEGNTPLMPPAQKHSPLAASVNIVLDAVVKVM
jgi:hypothetical protein